MMVGVADLFVKKGLLVVFFKDLFISYIYIERAHVSASWGRGRGIRRISSTHCALSPEPHTGLNLLTLRSDLSQKQDLNTEPTGPPRCPCEEGFHIQS